MYNVEMVYTDRKRLKNFKVHFRGPVGSIKGPRLVLVPMDIIFSVLRVPWNVFCCLVYKNTADTVGQLALTSYMIIAVPSCFSFGYFLFLSSFHHNCSSQTSTVYHLSQPIRNTPALGGYI